MAIKELELFRNFQRSNWVRLRTLVTLRWVAVAGQIAAVLVAKWLFGFDLPVGLISLTIGASIVVNLFLIFLYPSSTRVSSQGAFVMLCFDIIALAALLYLTGGLHNPFAVLILPPVTIAATMLNWERTFFLSVLTIVGITILALVHRQLITASGSVFALPGLFLFGFWAALVIGLAFTALYIQQVTNEMQSMGEALVATQIALAREQKLTDLGGVVAAAAHELGTPLATITLVSAELADELAEQPELLADARLIRSQADRCRDILRSMGRAGKDDTHLRKAPLEAVVSEAAEPHLQRGKTVTIDVAGAAKDAPEDEARQPVVLRRPEVIHGLRNLVQNAVDFSDENVIVEIAWSARTVSIRISDDGPGFAPDVLQRIGDPFMRRRGSDATNQGRRRGYEGMGLGLFIAKTLLERVGAKLSFANTRSQGRHGAIVNVKWDRASLDIGSDGTEEPLAANAPILP